MPLRRHHEKSHHGCAQCKRRRVKCDQERPICKRCTTYGGTCEYLWVAPLYPTAPPGASTQCYQLNIPSEREMPRDAGSSAVQHPRSPNGPIYSFDAETAGMSPALLRYLELMHYYTAFTCLTVSDIASLKSIWQDVVPREAQIHLFLMYGILALAALHIGHDQPSKQDAYTAIALKYYNVALTSFRAALKQVTKDNCAALFGFSAILIILSLAFAQSSSTSENKTVEQLIQIFTLLQGVRVVLESAMPWVEQGPLGPLLRMGDFGQKHVPKRVVYIPQTFYEALGCLESYNERMSQSVDSREMYKTAIKALRGCFENVESNPGKRAAALNWLVFLESAYASSIQSSQPLALVILAHYGVVLHGLREHWFIQDFGVRIVEVTYLSLNDEWRALIDWPMRQVGLRGEPDAATVSIETS